MKPQLLIACDFDGTITRQDTLVEILNKYGSTAWQDVQARVDSGELSIREGLQAEMKSVRATLEDLKHLLLTKIDLEPSFPSFLLRIRERGIPFVLLSGGFDLCVETVLAKTELWPLPYLANRLLRSNGSWFVEFQYPSLQCSACGHCKGDPIRKWNSQGYTTVFIGNGVTDRCGASAAHFTFAKDDLVPWCQSQGLAYLPFQTFEDIEQELIRRNWL